MTGGSARGRMLGIPRRSVTRPTSAKLREAIFASLGGFWFETVADLFAGSGILGIEALSRGASFATFVESNRAAASIVSSNLEKLGFADRSEVVARPVETILRSDDSVFDLALADPPYEYADLDGLVACVSVRLASEGGVLVLEHASRRLPPAAAKGLALSKTRTHGDSAFSVYVKG